MFSRELSLTLGAVAAIASSASAGVTFDSYSQSAGSSVKTGAMWPAFASSGYEIGQNSHNYASVTSSYFGLPADQATWGSAEGSFNGILTSTQSGTTITASGSSGFGLSNGQTGWEIRNGISQSIKFTLDVATTLTLSANWTVGYEYVAGSGTTSGGWSVYDLDGAGGDVVDYANPAGRDVAQGNTGFTGGSVTLAAGNYEVFFFTQQLYTYGDTTLAADFSFASSLSFSDAGSGGGGAVPGLGALAPLAAAGLARRRRR